MKANSEAVQILTRLDRMRSENTQKSTKNLMPNFGLIEEIMELFHISLAVFCKFIAPLCARYFQAWEKGNAVKSPGEEI